MDEVKIRVAIVGTGMAGLVTAHLLAQDPRQRYHVTIFEKGESLSLDSASVSLRDENTGAIERVDLPMRAIAGGYYNNTRRMYDHLGIRYHAQRFLFAFSEQQQQHDDGVQQDTQPLSHPYFIHPSNLHQLPPRPRGVTPVEHILRVLFVLLNYIWLTLCCFLVEPRADESFAEYIDRIWLPRRFADDYALPLMASVSTCPHQELLHFPASDIVNYKKRSHGSEHFVVVDGVREVQSKLAAGLNARTSAQVVQVVSSGSKVNVMWRPSTEGEGKVVTETFDRVVLAVSPDIVGQLFEPLHAAMSKIPTIAVINTILQPTDDGAKLQKVDPDGERTSAEAESPRLVRPSRTQLITLNTMRGPEARTEALHLVDCGAVVATCPFDTTNTTQIVHRWDFPRVLRTTESKRVVNRLMAGKRASRSTNEKAQWTNGTDKVWLVGGWCWDGMVLLEGCVTSAMRVADDFEVVVPWRDSTKARV